MSLKLELFRYSMKFTPFFQIYGIIIALKVMFVNYPVSHSFLKSLALQKSIPNSSM